MAMHETFPLAFVIGSGQIAAALALCNGVATAIGQGNVAGKAIEAMARQPEASGSINRTMFIGLAMGETSGIYGLVVSFLMLFANPLVALFMNTVGL